MCILIVHLYFKLCNSSISYYLTCNLIHNIYVKKIGLIPCFNIVVTEHVYTGTCILGYYATFKRLVDCPLLQKVLYNLQKTVFQSE